MTRRIEFGYRDGVVLAITGLVFLAAVLFYFDPERYRFYPVCVFHQATGLLCPGCGALRGMHQLLRGHIATAFRFNPLLFICLPATAAIAVRYFWAKGTKPQRPLAFPVHWVWLLAIGALALSVWRNLPGAPAAILPP
jgi:hypothetical protein